MALAAAMIALVVVGRIYYPPQSPSLGRFGHPAYVLLPIGMGIGVFFAGVQMAFKVANISMTIRKIGDLLSKPPHR